MDFSAYGQALETISESIGPRNEGLNIIFGLSIPANVQKIKRPRDLLSPHLLLQSLAGADHILDGIPLNNTSESALLEIFGEVATFGNDLRSGRTALNSIPAFTPLKSPSIRIRRRPFFPRHGA